MSAAQTSLSNFGRMLDQAQTLENAAKRFHARLFGESPEASSGNPKPPYEPDGFFPTIFHFQEEIEGTLARAASTLHEINKLIEGEEPQEAPRRTTSPLTPPPESYSSARPPMPPVSDPSGIAKDATTRPRTSGASSNA